MATIRKRGSRFEFVVKRRAPLPKLIDLMLDSMEEGAAYCSRLDALLDQGIDPRGFLSKLADVRAVDDLLEPRSERVDDKKLLQCSRAQLGR